MHLTLIKYSIKVCYCLHKLFFFVPKNYAKINFELWQFLPTNKYYNKSANSNLNKQKKKTKLHKSKKKISK